MCTWHRPRRRLHLGGRPPERRLVKDVMLPKVRYFAYVDIPSSRRLDSIARPICGRATMRSRIPASRAAAFAAAATSAGLPRTVHPQADGLTFMSDTPDAAPEQERERPWPKLLKRPSVPMPRPGAQRASDPIARGGEWTLSTLEKFDVALARHSQRLGLDTVPDPVRADHGRPDDRPVLDRRHAGALRALELRQAAAVTGARLPQGTVRALHTRS